MSFVFRSPAARRPLPARVFLARGCVGVHAAGQPGGGGADLFPVTPDARRVTPPLEGSNIVLARTRPMAIVRGAGTFAASP